MPFHTPYPPLATNLTPAGRGGRARPRAIAIWLLVVAGMVWVMVALGGATRLTGSGLSIMEWAPLTGALPPMSEAEWQRLYDLYRTIPQYQSQNAGFGLEGFQRIFWLEWAHRLWGRVIGMAYLLPFLWFWLRGRVPPGLMPRLLVLFVLGGMQGAIGWFMVASGFHEGRVSVAPFRLVAHLGMALLLYGALVWTALGLLQPQAAALADAADAPAPGPPGAANPPPGAANPLHGAADTPPGAADTRRGALRRQVKWAFALAVLTMLAGGFVAGLRAGFAYNSFPLMDGQWVPAGYADLSPWWRNLTGNIAAVQFNHRLLASLALLAALGAAVSAWRAPAGAARHRVLEMAGAVLLQYGIGVLTLLHVVPTGLGTLHQGVAVLVLTTGLLALHALRPGPAQTSRPGPHQTLPPGPDPIRRPGPQGATRPGLPGHDPSPPMQPPFMSNPEGERIPEVLAQAFNALPSAVMLFDAQHRLVLANSPMMALAGVDARRLASGLPLAEIIRLLALRGLYGPGNPESQIAEWVRLDRSRPSRHMLRHADGTTLELRVQPMADGGFLDCITDMTALAAPLETSMADLRRLEAVFDQLSLGVALYDHDDRLVLRNSSYPALVGLPAAQTRPGDTIAGLTGKLADGDEVETAEIEAWSANLEQTHERLRPDGTALRIRRKPLPDGATLHEVSDVTAERMAMADAQRRAAMLDGILSALPAGVVVWDAEGRAVMVNEAYNAIMTGSPVRLGEAFTEVMLRRARNNEYGPGDPDALLAEMLARMQTPVTFERRRPDGRMVSFGVKPLAGGGQVVSVTDVTPLHNARAEATARAAMLSTMLDGMHHGIALFDADGTVRAVNRLAAEMCGLTPEQFVPGVHMTELRVMQLKAQEFIDVPDQTAFAARRPDQPWRGPDRYLRTRPNGQVLEIVTNKLPDGGFVRTYSDVSALHAAQAAAQARAAMLQTMLDSIRHGLSMYGPDGRLIAANPLASRLSSVPDLHRRTGITLAQALTEQKDNGAFGEGSNADAMLRWLLELDRTRSHAFQRQAPDGRIFEVVSDPTADGGFVITNSDVSKIAAAEAEAKHRAEVLGAMLENIRHGICLFGADNRVLAANRIFHELIGMPADVVAPGRLFSDFVADLLASGGFGGGEAAAAAAAFRLELDRSKPVSYFRIHPNGRAIETVSDPIPGGGFVITYTDVTDEHRVRAELERARDAAEAGNAAKSRFLATMSHELRTPLTAVIGFAKALQLRPDAPARTQYLDAIHDAGQHLLALINDILDVARAEQDGLAVQEQVVDIAELVLGVARVMQAAALTGKVGLSTSIGPNLPPVRADALRLRQVMLNLLSNAVKFTPPGGTVRVTAAMEPDGGLLLSVTDTGIGMAEADIPHVFKPFNQLDGNLNRRFAGSGLGLPLSRALARAKGAELSLQSQPGQGTTALLRIPASCLLLPERIH